MIRKIADALIMQASMNAIDIYTPPQKSIYKLTIPKTITQSANLTNLKTLYSKNKPNTQNNRDNRGMHTKRVSQNFSLPWLPTAVPV